MPSESDSGFTLLELIVNLAIIGILTAVAVPAYIAFRDKARVAQAKSDLKNIQLAMEQLANDTELWPGPNPIGSAADDAEWDLSKDDAGLVKADPNKFPGWKGPYLQSVPKDPWGSNYFFDPTYNIGGTRYVVVGSFGPNKCCRDAPDSDDIVIKIAQP